MHRINNQSGFTLLEVMIAAAVLAIGMLAYAGMQLSGTRGNADAISITGKSNWAADQVEKLLAMTYDDLVAMDVDGDGTNQDTLEVGLDKDDNGDTVVDNNENFGLHHDTAATADGNTVSPDNRFSIFWNVAVDKPLINTVTVNVIVMSSQQGNAQPLHFDYIKARLN